MNVPVLPRDVPVPEDSSAKGQGALDTHECQQLDAYWRAANYLSVGQIYLYANPLLREPLTLARRQAPGPETPPRRRGPTGAMSDDALTVKIRAVLAASRFHGEGHRKVWARLRHAGARTSRRRVLRLMRKHGLLAPSRAGSPRGPRNRDGTIIPKQWTRCGEPT
jgi:HTH-like domain/XFP N-terminal domain